MAQVISVEVDSHAAVRFCTAGNHGCEVRPDPNTVGSGVWAIGGADMAWDAGASDFLTGIPMQDSALLRFPLTLEPSESLYVGNRNAGGPFPFRALISNGVAT